ncbi:uncharacterized protein J3D65DRAFT_607139 [Phyllosticta citribraziliensis]|uniref:Uncharacterized protein n=1 Tax=Phyllosticta citribraziliensis TaxID=989973 RepID=A0ABR1L6R4_9PEZI
MNVISSPTTFTSRRDSRNSHAPSRIEKPRSIHNSPTGLGRRKTTTAVKRYVTLEDRWDMVFGATEPQPAEEVESCARSHTASSSRPVSWHPLSSDAFGLDSTENLNSDSTSASPASGYASAPAMAYLTALAERKKEQYPVPGLSSTEPSMISSYPGCQDQPMADLTYSAPNYSSRAPHTSNPRIESGSSDFLAESTDYMDPDSKDSGDVLVGMGLYDPPNYESMLTSGFGKGLKLEETWQPPEDAEDDSSDDESADEPAEQESAAQHTKSTSQQYWSPPTTQQTTTCGSDGILGPDESMYMNEWWYQQLKRPTAHATGLGYGWLQQVQY